MNKKMAIRDYYDISKCLWPIIMTVALTFPCHALLSRHEKMQEILKTEWNDALSKGKKPYTEVNERDTTQYLDTDFNGRYDLVKIIDRDGELFSKIPETSKDGLQRK